MSGAKDSAEVVSVDALEALIAAALAAVGTSPSNAASVARALTAAEVDGQGGHGLSRLASYAGQVRAGKIDGKAVPSCKKIRAATLAIDAAHGFAFPAFDLAVAELPALAAETGIAAAGVSRSHHAGALGLVVERLARAGLVGIMFANTPSAMAVWSGRRALLGTNPIAFAAPRGNGDPIVIDLALSSVARGKIMTAAQKGESIPEGWALDKDGLATTDAKAALQGTLLPAGGAKGAALALMVELLAAALTGSHFASEASSFLDDKGSPPATGQMIMAVHPAAFGDAGTSLARIEALAAMIEGDGAARLPGSLRRALREQARSNGLRVDARLLADARKLAG